MDIYIYNRFHIERTSIINNSIILFPITTLQRKKERKKEIVKLMLSTHMLHVKSNEKINSGQDLRSVTIHGSPPVLEHRYS